MGDEDKYDQIAEGAQTARLIKGHGENTKLTPADEKQRQNRWKRRKARKLGITSWLVGDRIHAAKKLTGRRGKDLVDVNEKTGTVVSGETGEELEDI